MQQINWSLNIIDPATMTILKCANYQINWHCLRCVVCHIYTCSVFMFVSFIRILIYGYVTRILLFKIKLNRRFESYVVATRNLLLSFSRSCIVANIRENSIQISKNPITKWYAFFCKYCGLFAG